ncbi:aldehyde dehydrogenase family protein [Streptomyces achromogenes]|uniref:aldehyde dehydrogenase family protein n=1 Tax=Streptomyces achromogenes TaxID=67255 RepID=UPI0038663783
MQPTLFGDVDNSMRAAREDIFGPVVCLLPYGDEREALRIADDSEYGRSGSVWTAGIEHGTDIARRIRTGTYSVHTSSPDARPVRRLQTSGLGRAFGPEGYGACLEHKTIHLPTGA